MDKSRLGKRPLVPYLEPQTGTGFRPTRISRQEESTEVITCQKCGKENQDHYKFCLGCGAELTRDLVAPAPGPSLQASPAITSPSPAAAPAAIAANKAPAASPLAADATHASPGAQSADDAERTAVIAGAEPSVSVVAIAGATSGTAQPQPPDNGSSSEETANASKDEGAPVAAEANLEGSSAQPALSADSPGEAPAVGDLGCCPQCARQNADGNRFCASCGYKLNMSSLPARPADVQAANNAGSGDISLTALRADGSEAGSFALPSSPSETVGRDTGSIFSGDSYLSPRHATFARKGDRLLVSDAGSLNGVYFKISPNTPWTLKFGDVFRIGQEILRLEKLEGPNPSPDGVRRLGSPVEGYVARLGLVIGRDTTGNAFPVPRAGLHLGRERGDVLFPEDGYVSGLHCRLTVGVDGAITLTDLGSSNGSFVRLKDEHPVTGGDILLMGQQLFRIDA